MKFTQSFLTGAYIIDIERLGDNRGSFARSWCQKEFENNGLDTRVVQCNLAHNEVKGTLRGMHYQLDPFSEIKTVRCVSGSIRGVMVDLRPESCTYKRYDSVIISSKNGRMLYVPKRFAFGFITLEDDSDVFYQMSEFYTPEYYSGFRWNDPSFNINWPEDMKIISEKDRAYPDYE